MSTSRVVSPDISPLCLRQLSRSHREILEKKSKMVKGIEMMKAEENGENMDMSLAMMLGEGKEVMVQLRLFYLGVVRRMKDRVKEETETHGRERLEDGRKRMGKELDVLREKVNFVEMKDETRVKLLMIRREMECLELVRKEEERKHL